MWIIVIYVFLATIVLTCAIFQHVFDRAFIGHVFGCRRWSGFWSIWVRPVWVRFLQPAYFAQSPFWSIVARFSPIDVRIGCSGSDVINLVIFAESFAFYLSSHLLSCRGGRDRYLKVYILSDCSSGQNYSCQFIQCSIPTCEPPGRLALPYRSVVRVSQNNWKKKGKTVRIRQHNIFWNLKNVDCRWGW